MQNLENMAELTGSTSNETDRVCAAMGRFNQKNEKMVPTIVITNFETKTRTVCSVT